MLNTNLDLNITEYATVDFNALTTVIDALGGLDIPMSYAEIEHMNNYCVETSQETGKSYTPIEKPEPAPEDQEAIIGTYHLNGVQATSYCRIRYTASLDMGRTERQRRVIQMIVNKAKGAGLATIFDIMDEVFPMVQTSLTQTEILKLIPAMIGYSLDDTTGFPQNYKFSNIKGSIIVPTNLDTNVAELHKFLYGEENYTPTALVTEVSNKILEIVGGSEQLVDEAPVTSEEDANADLDFTWQDNGDGGSWNDNSGGDGSYDPGTGGDGNYDPGTGGDGNYDPGTGGDGNYDPGTGGDTGGGDIGGGDTGGGDIGGGGTGGGDIGGGDTGGGDIGGGDAGGGDTGGGDVGGGETAPDGGGGEYTESTVTE